MAQPYYNRLKSIAGRLEPRQTAGAKIETKHFFSGAALYANGKICATLGPAGFALKLPSEVRETLIAEGKGTEFRFFDKGPIKREYMALTESVVEEEEALQPLLGISVSYVIGVPE